MSGIREINEQSMVAAHIAGMHYWRSNRPCNASKGDLSAVAQSCGWHGEDMAAWLAGYYGAMNRDKGV